VWAVSSKVAWASGIGGTFVLTIDGGRTWRAGVVPGADSLEFRDVHAFSADRAVLLAAGPGEKSRIYLTIDGGLTWGRTFQNSEPNGFYDCFDFRGDTAIVVSDAIGDRFPLERTTDGGRTWAPYQPPGWDAIRAVPKEGAFAASGTCVTYRSDGAFLIGTATGGRVIIVGRDRAEVVKTPIIAKESAGIATLAFRSATIGVAAGGDLAQPDAHLDNVIVTRSGGRSWSLGGRPPFGGPVYGLAYVPSRAGTVVAVGPKGAAWSADDGRTWRRLDDKDHWAVAFAADGTGWAVGPGGRISKISFR
jgi:photosystem II stability/assembly factor-like uncharacterized protein